MRRRRNRIRRPGSVDQLDPDAKKLLRDIIAECLRAQHVGAGMPKNAAVDSVIELIEAGFARIESWDDPLGEPWFRIAILTDAGWQ